MTTVLWRRWGMAVAQVLWLAACSSAPPVPVLTGPVPVGEVALLLAESEAGPQQPLDVGVVVFTAAPVDPLTSQVSPWLNGEIRAKETQYLPYVLRNTLVQSNQWGAVRVLPESDPSVDLNLYGEILQSDGMRLVIRVRALDSSGRLWLERDYADETEVRDFPVTRTTARYPEEELQTPEDPFVDLYEQVANDLLQFRTTLGPEALDNIRQVSSLHYAMDLSPETFAGTLVPDAAGLWQVQRLPADNDPMMRRVNEIKLRHYLFIDTVDQYYQSLYAEMQPPYDLWRRYSREQILEQRERPAMERDGSRGFRALSQSYDRYRWARIFEQEFADLALGFNNEVAPAIVELNRQVHGLSGSLEEQYGQWREILRQLFELGE